MNKRPNILFFFTDDQRFDTLSGLGHPVVRTPNIDKLMARGTSFTRAHIPGGTSGAVCMPSRAMLHTGRSLFHLEREGQSIPADHVTMCECFRDAGYDTHGIGKWHNGRESFSRSFGGGAEIFFGGMSDHWNVPCYSYDPDGKYTETRPICVSAFHSNEVVHRDCDHVTTGKHSSELFADAAIDYLSERDSEIPFFLYVSLLAPHDPRTMPEPFRAMYDPEDIPLPENFMAYHPFDNGALHIRDEKLAEFPRQPDEIRRHIAEYYGMISHLDNEFGRVMAALDATGERDNTIVVFAGDNGLAVGQHGLMGKQNLYDHSVRVPLIFAGPGVPEGEKRDAWVYLFDIFPTLCELTNVTAPPSVEGRSMRSCLDAPTSTIRDSLYLAYTGTIRGVRKDNYKLIKYAVHGTRAIQMFDLANDPSELRNLAGSTDAKDIQAQLESELERLRDEWDDTAHPMGETFWKAWA